MRGAETEGGAGDRVFDFGGQPGQDASTSRSSFIERA
jgi:hypothetical protein